MALVSMRHSLLLLKLGLSGVLLWYLVGKLDFTQAFEQVLLLPLGAVAVILVLLSMQILASAQRLRCFLGFLDHAISRASAARITLVGYFFSQILISFIGGDGVRIWQLVQKKIPIRNAAHAIFLDRTAGLITQMVVIICTSPVIFSLTQDPAQRWGLVLLMVLGVAGVATLILFRHIPLKYQRWRVIKFFVDLSGSVSEIVRDKFHRLRVLGYSLMINATNIMVIYVAAQGLGLEIAFWQVLALVPAVLFLSQLPISFAGWGVREGSMVIALGLVGVPANMSLAVSVVFGISLLVISLPGSMLWFSIRNRASTVAQE